MKKPKKKSRVARAAPNNPNVLKIAEGPDVAAFKSWLLEKFIGGRGHTLLHFPMKGSIVVPLSPFTDVALSMGQFGRDGDTRLSTMKELGDLLCDKRPLKLYLKAELEMAYDPETKKGSLKLRFD
jgi:hypothetical protein